MTKGDNDARASFIPVCSGIAKLSSLYSLCVPERVGITRFKRTRISACICCWCALFINYRVVWCRFCNDCHIDHKVTQPKSQTLHDLVPRGSKVQRSRSRLQFIERVANRRVLQQPLHSGHADACAICVPSDKHSWMNSLHICTSYPRTYIPVPRSLMYPRKHFHLNAERASQNLCHASLWRGTTSYSSRTQNHTLHSPDAGRRPGGRLGCNKTSPSGS